VKSEIVKRSVVIGGHKTSVSLEDAFWQALRAIAAENGRSLSDLVAEIDARRAGGNLSSAIRLHVLRVYQAKTGS
jgi:predicted DNA-binding ribbon-helix-helix protein